MKDGTSRVLIAAPVAVVRELGAVLNGMEVLGAQTLEDALKQVSEEQLDLIVVCYVFDELRPYRLIQQVRGDWEDKQIPMMLVRALPVRLGTEESQVRDSYLAMGVDQFLNLWGHTERDGRVAALQHFRTCVLSLVPYVPQQDSA